MKTVAYFNPKGGVGKSLHTTMFAAWLAYSQGARVLVFDGENDSRLINDRGDEEELMKDPKSPLARYLAKDPVGVPFYEIRRLGDRTAGYTKDYVEEVVGNQIQFIRSNEGEYDYVLYDFPAGVFDYSVSYVMMCSGVIDGIFIPIDTNKATWREALNFGNALRKKGIQPVLFWNNITQADLSMKGYLEGLAEIFGNFGFEVMSEKVRYFVKAERDSDSPLFVRSTVCWPQRYVELNCPYLLDFYRAVKERLDRE